MRDKLTILTSILMLVAGILDLVAGIINGNRLLIIAGIFFLVSPVFQALRFLYQRKADKKEEREEITGENDVQ